MGTHMHHLSLGIFLLFFFLILLFVIVDVGWIGVNVLML